VARETLIDEEGEQEEAECAAEPEEGEVEEGVVGLGQDHLLREWRCRRGNLQGRFRHGDSRGQIQRFRRGDAVEAEAAFWQ
jgi:hypothetical protein